MGVSLSPEPYIRDWAYVTSHRSKIPEENSGGRFSVAILKKDSGRDS